MKKLIIPDPVKISLTEFTDWFNGLKSPFITVEDLNIPYSTRLLWADYSLFQKQTLTNGFNEQEKRFNLYDWVWYQVLYDLTKMGIGFETLKSIKTVLSTEFDKTIINGFKIPKEALKKLLPDYEINLDVYDDVITIDQSILNIIPTLNPLELLVNEALLLGSEISLLYRYDGFLGFLKNSQPFQVEGIEFNYDLIGIYNKHFVPYPHITIPINKYIKAFIAGYTNLKDFKLLAFVSKNEREVLNTLHENNLKQLTIKLNQTNKTIKEIEYVKDRDLNSEELYSLLRSKPLKNQFGVNIRNKGNGGFYYEEFTKRKFE